MASLEERLEHAASLRSAGNEKRASEPLEALRLYDEAAAVARTTTTQDSSSSELLAAVLKNGAAMALQLGDMETAEARATEAMEVEGQTVTSLYRRAVARRRSYDFEGAYDDLTQALSLDDDPSAESVLRQEMMNLRRAFMAAQKAEDDQGQALRLGEVAKLLPVGGTADDLRRCLDEPFYAAQPTDVPLDDGLFTGTTTLDRVQVEELRRSAGVVTTDGKAQLSYNNDDNNTGPYQLDATVTAKEGSPYAEGVPLTFRLVFTTRWPLAPPKVRCVSLIRHSLFAGPKGDHNAHHARRATIEFYEHLLVAFKSKGGGGAKLTVECVLAAIRDVLDGPPLTLEELSTVKETTTEKPFCFRAPTSWDREARQDQERRKIIRKFVEEFPHALPELYDASRLEKAMVAMLPEKTRSAIFDRQDPFAAVEVVGPGIFAFDLFTEDAATAFLAEIDCFYASNLPAQRPNSMNAYGVIVNDIGLEPFITLLQQKVFQPLARALFAAGTTTTGTTTTGTTTTTTGTTTTPPQKGHPGTSFDSHHAFIVRYRRDEDSHLDIHTDDSDVTFNVSLGRPGFAGSNLIFCGIIGTKDHRQHCVSYEHQLGKCVVHLGNRRHGTDDISQGERMNLIVWCHSLAWRDSTGATHHNRHYEEEDQPPDPRCLSYTHDRDYGVFKQYPPGRQQHKGKGWCPPPGAEYPNFVPET